MLERTLLVVLAMLWLPAGLRAEEPGTLAVGSRVRVTSQETGARPLIGQVVALEPGAVVVTCEGGAGQKRVPKSHRLRWRSAQARSHELPAARWSARRSVQCLGYS
jgi:hypothetical protein